MSEPLWTTLQAGAETTWPGLTRLAALGLRHREVSALVEAEPWEDDDDELTLPLAAATEAWVLPCFFAGDGHRVTLGVSFAGETYLELTEGTGPLVVRVQEAAVLLELGRRIPVSLDRWPPAGTLTARDAAGRPVRLDRA